MGAGLQKPDADITRTRTSAAASRAGIQPFMLWHDQFKTAALAKRIKAHPAYTEGLGRVIGIIGPEDTTDTNSIKPELSGEHKRGGVVEIDFNLATSEGVNIYSRRDGDGEFKFLAGDTFPPYVDNRPMLVPGKPELHNYKAVFVVADQEVSQFRDEISVNCAPLV